MHAIILKAGLINSYQWKKPQDITKELSRAVGLDNITEWTNALMNAYNALE